MPKGWKAVYVSDQTHRMLKSKARAAGVTVKEYVGRLATFDAFPIWRVSTEGAELVEAAEK